ncbi:DUF4974 domain-containing protein [Segetibacter sp. 3557_3]|uniref:FecR family protein n=1 Tax=Segetibacter sp. 3557_3 TaxID=2547429 RepID=UPI001058B6D0|nr:FecR domain-containing protein [Segetibacter sp. 3557_3]TDH27043.1 DUF4974 domain-containing protein [Segetibacter sp. 3557_3]
MGTEQDFERLHEQITAYVNNSCSDADQLAVEQWYEQLDTGEAELEPEEKALVATEIYEGLLARKTDRNAGTSTLRRLAPARRRSVTRKLFAIAAIFLVVVGIGTIIYLLNTGQQASFSTAYGKTDTVFLPDHSAVVLNANSSIRYAKRWNPDQPREVWLDGEALFMVTNLREKGSSSKGDHFLVHVKNATVEVLGTVFNIRERRGKTEIVLQKGSIKVAFSNQSKAVKLSPGQMIIVEDAGKKITQTKTKADDYTAWTQQKLILADPTLQNIIAYLEDNYGKKIILSQPELAQRRIGGTLMIDNLEDALFILSKTLDLTITAEGDRLFISPR